MVPEWGSQVLIMIRRGARCTCSCRAQDRQACWRTLEWRLMRPPRSVSLQRSWLSRLTANGVVVLAMLLQVMFATPLAIRMAAAATLTGDGGAECASTLHVDASHAGREQVPPHHHEQCPLCDGHAAPVALPAVAPPLPPRSTAWLFLRPPPTAPPGQQARFALYRSRAPPAAA